MIDILALKKIFKDNHDKSNITFKGKCSDCGCKVTIDITPTAGGFGLQGGALYEGYFVKCPDCYKAHPEGVCSNVLKSTTNK